MSASYEAKQSGNKLTPDARPTQDSSPLPKSSHSTARGKYGAASQGVDAAKAKIENLISILDRQMTEFLPRIEGSASNLKHADISSMRDTLYAERSDMMSAVAQLAPGDPLSARATNVADNAGRVLSRLDAIDRARAAREATAREAAIDDQQNHDEADKVESGGTQFALPRSNAVAQHRAHDPSQLNTPGRSRLVDRLHPTSDFGGNAGIDSGGGACVAEGGPGCFLNDNQRQTLLIELACRLESVQTAYTIALTELKIEREIRQESELGVVGDLIIAMLVGNAASGATAALKRLLNVGEPTRYVRLAKIRNTVHPEAAVQSIGAKQIDGLVRSAATPAQAQMRASLAAPGGEKEQVTSYADWLRDNSMIAFQHLREDPIATATDADLLVMFASYEGSFHTTSHYKTLLRAELDKYMASHASEIGRQGHGNFTREVRVAWIREGGTRLAYVSRDFGNVDIVATHLPDGNDGGAYRNAPMLGYDEGAAHLSPIEKVDGMLGWVEPEYADLALQKHEATWLQKPDVYFFDYSHGAPRLMKE